MHEEKKKTTRAPRSMRGTTNRRCLFMPNCEWELIKRYARIETVSASLFIRRAVKSHIERLGFKSIRSAGLMAQLDQIEKEQRLTARSPASLPTQGEEGHPRSTESP